MKTMRIAICLGFVLALSLAQASAQAGTGVGDSQVQSNCLDAATTDQAAPQPAGIGLPSVVPCGTTRTIYQNASSNPVTLHAQVGNNCTGGNITFLHKDGKTMYPVQPIGPGQTQTISFTVPAADTIQLMCGGTMGKGCSNILLGIKVN